MQRRYLIGGALAAESAVQLLNVSYDPTRELYRDIRNYYRPRNPQVAAKYAGRFPKVALLTIDRNFGGWQRAQAAHFNDGGLFDQIFEEARR